MICARYVVRQQVTEGRKSLGPPSSLPVYLVTDPWDQDNTLDV